MDPNNPQPMSYDSLKILLQYAKANLRFELSRRIPSIRLMEKLVPLSIDKLSIGSHGVEVNGMRYEVRVKRHFSPDDIDLRGFLFDYTSPDGEWDLDEWGFEDFSSENLITPGDLVLQVEGYGPRQGDRSEQRMNAIENHLRFIEWMVAKKSGENVEPDWTGEAIGDSFKTQCEEASLTKLKGGVVQFKIDLAPFHCLMKNVPLPFTKTIQVHFGSFNPNWRYSGHLKCYEVRKQLMIWLFGNRKPVIQVNHLTVTNGIIARLSENLRISVKTLQCQKSYGNVVDTNTMLNKLQAIVHQENCPLEVFETNKMEENFDHPLVTNAKKLVISERWAPFPNSNWLIRIPNQKIHISTTRSLNSEEIIQLIRNWIETPREVGKSLSFEGGERSVMNTMKQIQSLFIGVKRKRWIRIPVNNFSKISVSYDTEVLWRENSKFRLMTIEVVAA